MIDEKALKASGKAVRGALLRAKSLLNDAKSEIAAANKELDKILTGTPVKGSIGAVFWILGGQVQLALDAVVWLSGAAGKAEGK